MITSSSNSQIRALHSLIRKPRERRRQGVFVVEGQKLVAEAPREWIEKVYYSHSYGENPKAKPVLADFERAGIDLVEVSDAIYKAVSDTQTPQGILGVVRTPRYDWESLLRGKDTLLLILEGIQDPGNLGTMFRTGEGAGVTGIIMNRATVDLFNPKTIRSTMGSIFRVPFLISEDLGQTLQRLKTEGVCIYAAHLKGNRCYDESDYREACAFLIGNEGNGLSDEATAFAEGRLRIPMEGKVESLNAAVSAALLLYEANRQRRSREMR